MSIEVIKNFDWEITKRKLCIFMPNYHGREFTEFSIKNIKTSIPKDQYVVIIGDDNTGDDFENMKEYNAYYFSLRREEKSMRNGCFIRNYLIKRCQSELFFQKDGEVVVLGDFVKNCIESETPWRAGNIYVLTHEETEHYLRDGELKAKITKKIDRIFPSTAEEVKMAIVYAKGCVNLSSYFHYAYCVKTDILKNMNGYDESYYYYGYEDSDMFCRLYSLGHKIIPDYSCSAVHLFHPRDTIDFMKVSDMADYFKDNDPNNVVRNLDGWGEGI